MKSLVTELKRPLSPHRVTIVAMQDISLLAAKQITQNNYMGNIDKAVWIIIGLGVILVIVAIRFIRLLIWKRRQKHAMSENSRRGRTSYAIESDPRLKKPVMNPGKAGAINKNRTFNGPKAELQWKRERIRIPIMGRSFILGSFSGAVDFVIENNRSISRTHAEIVWDVTGYRIYDLNSSNGTFLNGRRVPKEGSWLNNGDVIKLANEEFRFRVI